MLAGSGDGGIDHIGDLKGVIGTGNDAEMADGEDRGVIETVDKGHTARYLLKVQRSYGFENSGRGSSYCRW